VHVAYLVLMNGVFGSMEEIINFFSYCLQQYVLEDKLLYLYT